MTGMKNKNKIKRCVVMFFGVIIGLPFFLHAVSVFTGATCDMKLKGFYEKIEKPVFTGGSFLCGDYQQSAEAWLKDVYKPSGFFTTVYNTIQYDFFHLANRIVGKNHDIFELQYITDCLCLDDAHNFALEENKSTLKEYIQNMEEIQKKLKQYGKDFFVYVTPSKAVFHYDNIPKKYIRMKKKSAVRAVDVFRSFISQTEVPCFFSSDLVDELQYPAFYTTGIHWSRTFEQTASRHIVEQIAQATGKSYAKLQIGSVKESKKPFWRDADVYDLLNIFQKAEETYYEYETIPDVSDSTAPIKMLLQGGSFAQGLMKDLMDIDVSSEIYYINYDNYLMQGNDIIRIEDQDWNNLALTQYLDKVDLVVIELNEAVIHGYSNGFVKYLNDFLNIYSLESSTEKEKGVQ